MFADSVNLNPISAPPVSGGKFEVSGTAKMREGHTLWVVAYQSAGFNVASHEPIPVNPKTHEWHFTPVIVGRPPDNKGKCPDCGSTYTVSAVIVDKDGTKLLQGLVGTMKDSPAC